MKHSNISIFIPHAGCPHKCSFCNQKTISGAQKQPTAEEVHEICRKALEEVPDRKNCEIAFFGGSFTAIDRDYMISLLEAAKCFLGENGFYGIRISTRPDFIDREVLEILKSYGVTAIELGAQSMRNKVLQLNERGHSVEDVYNACDLIREYDFELGLQMMVGLYGSSEKYELDTRDRILKIRPDTVRIYPVVILEGTKLAELYKSGEYELMEFDHAVEVCARILLKFEKHGIKVIKCGLHASDGVEGEMIGGYYHPAFREICESDIYRKAIQKAVLEWNSGIGYIKIAKGETYCYTIAVNPSCISKALGHKKSNVKFFKEMNIDIKVIGDEKIPKYQCEIRG